MYMMRIFRAGFTRLCGSDFKHVYITESWRSIECRNELTEAHNRIQRTDLPADALGVAEHRVALLAVKGHRMFGFRDPPVLVRPRN